jgi:hypothetical protein
MENTKTCPIEQQLYKLATSVRSKSELTSFLYLLKKIIFNLLENPSNGAYKAIRKDGEISNLTLLNAHETRDLLSLLGYTEEGDHYAHCLSDENMMKLRHCLTLLQDLIKKHEDAILAQVNTDNNSSFDLGSNRHENEMESLPKLIERSRAKTESCSGKFKDLFLLKHLKKESSDGMGLLSNEQKRNKSRSSDYAFNKNGYFQQTCNNTNRDDKKNKCFIREIFHQQDQDSKKWSSSGYSNVKLA